MRNVRQLVRVNVCASGSSFADVRDVRDQKLSGDSRQSGQQLTRSTFWA